METVNTHEAKTQFSPLADPVVAGADAGVSRNGKPLVRLTRLESTRRTIRFGVLKGEVKLAAEFDAPLPDAVLAGFERR